MPLIEVKNLVKTYEEGGVATPALRGMTFSMEPGEFIAIMGPSGSGKSTLLHILGFLDLQTGGGYSFRGKSNTDYSKVELAQARNKDMGFVFQAFHLMPRTTVYDNVKLPLMYSEVPEHHWDKLVKNAIAVVGLTERSWHESAQLSGGEKQRVAIARALVNNPQVIFADEPTGNLDSKSGQTIMDILQKLNEEERHTIILITHETYTAEHAQRILHIRDGMIERDESVNHRRKAFDGALKESV